MANFHTNLLVVAANEQDMLEVLKLCAHNFLACADTTHFHLQNFEQYESANELYRQLEGYLEGWYEYALSGVSGMAKSNIGITGAEDLPRTSAVTWGINEISRSYLNEGIDRLASYFANLTGNPNIEISVSTAPMGRPLSDSADVHLHEYASTFVLSIGYSTAWEPNSGGLDAFFELLKPGDYGVAFLDADEGDGYLEVSTFCGLHHGGRGLKDLDAPRVDSQCDALDLETDAKKYVKIKREEICSIVELAYTVAVCRWPEYESAQEARYSDEYYDQLDENDDDDFYGWYEANYPQEINYEEEYEKYHYGKSSGLPFGSSRIDWINPREVDLKRIAECLVEMMRRLPVHALLDDMNCKVNQDAIASALAGDEVYITSTWNDSNPDAPVTLTVENLDGMEFGCLGDGDLWSKYGPHELEGNQLATVACLLPHLTSRVDKVMPIALRSGHAKHSIFIVRIELCDEAHEQIEGDVRALLARPCGERNSRSSVGRRR